MTVALGDLYASLPELKARYDIDDTEDDTRLTDALTASSREIEAWCGRQFNDAGTPSARLFRSRGCGLAVVDDFSTTTGLVVAADADEDGVFEQTWTAGDYQLEPLNGVVAGVDGWPYWRIRAVGSRAFPTTARRATIQVTARWGWTGVPAQVKDACLLIASESFKLGDAPFGVAGFGEFGPVRVRMNSRAQSLLEPYRRDPVLVA